MLSKTISRSFDLSMERYVSIIFFVLFEISFLTEYALRSYSKCPEKITDFCFLILLFRRWAALISLLKFLVNQEPNLIKKCNIFHLAIQIINIFNLFITYGDTFLATTNSYDELYYELNREEKAFTELHAMGM